MVKKLWGTNIVRYFQSSFSSSLLYKDFNVSRFQTFCRLCHLISYLKKKTREFKWFGRNKRRIWNDKHSVSRHLKKDWESYPHSKRIPVNLSRFQTFCRLSHILRIQDMTFKWLKIFIMAIQQFINVEIWCLYKVYISTLHLPVGIAG